MINPKDFCIETIRCYDGKLENLELHSQRMKRTCKGLWGLDWIKPLNEIIEIPEDYQKGLYKCRIIYGGDTVHQIDWEGYQKRKVQSVKIIESPEANYCFKYRDRSHLEFLFAQKENLDDILITQNGFITDTYVCNVAFYDGKQWFTPEKPLLNGTQRTYLINNRVIVAENIHQNDLAQFEKFRLFNAMMPWQDSIELPISGIHH